MPEALKLLYQPMSAGFTVWPKQCPEVESEVGSKEELFLECQFWSEFTQTPQRSNTKNHLFCLQAALPD